jgi:tetratricopeptide (TPR) repeat protein
MNDHALRLKREGNRALARRDYEASAEAFRELIQLAPEASEGYLGLAKVLERTHEHQAVIDLLEPVISKVKSPGLKKALGDAYRVLANRGQKPAASRAIDLYEDYLSQRKDPVTLFYLAGLYRLEKDYERALALFRESWSLDPGSRSVYSAALDCARRLGHDEDVKEIETWRSELRR